MEKPAATARGRPVRAQLLLALAAIALVAPAQSWAQPQGRELSKRVEVHDLRGDALAIELLRSPRSVGVQQTVPGSDAARAIEGSKKWSVPTAVSAQDDLDLLRNPDSSDPRSVRQVACDGAMAFAHRSFDGWRPAALTRKPEREPDPEFPRHMEDFPRWYRTTTDIAEKQHALPVTLAVQGALAVCFDSEPPPGFPATLRASLGSIAANDGLPFCTVLVVAPRIVASARHCVEPRQVRLSDAQVAELRVALGPSRTTRKVRGYHRIDQSSSALLPDDWVLLELEGEPLQVSVPSLVEPGALPVGTRVVIGGLLVPPDPSREPKAAMFASTLSCLVVFATDQCIVHTCNTLPGLSGAPIFVRGAGGSWLLAGLHSRPLHESDLIYCPAPGHVPKGLRANGAVHAAALPK